LLLHFGNFEKKGQIRKTDNYFLFSKKKKKSSRSQLFIDKPLKKKILCYKKI